MGRVLPSREDIDIQMNERLGPDLCQNRPRFRGGIGGFGDGAADDDVAGSGGDGFCGSGYAGLIGVAGSGGADAGSDDGEVVA